jgi:GT2 family glycosyltransferase
LTAVSVIIPNLNGGEMLLACIDCIRRQSFENLELILVDNGSTDGSPQRACEKYPGLTLVSLDFNQGFAGACVKGLAHAKGVWIAVLNNDARPEDGWLAELVEAAESEPGVGMVASRVLMDDEPGRIDSLGMMAGSNGLIYLAGHGDPEEAHPDSPRFKEVFGAPAVAALYSRKMIQDIGFFEDNFFAYYEDADLAFRARWAGWKCLLANRARVRHSHSMTAKAIGLKKTYYLHRNRIRTFIRNWPFRSIIRNFHRLVFYDIITFMGAVYMDRSLDALWARSAFVAGCLSDLWWRIKHKPLRKAEAGDIDQWLTAGYPSALSVFNRKRDER